MTDFAFLHGGGQGGWVWEPTIVALHGRDGVSRMLALDVPGCGLKRGRDTAALDFDDIIGELIDDIEQADLHDVVLVGHSQAGCVLPRIAQARPDLLRRLVYLACSSPLSGETVQEMVGTGVHGNDPDHIGWPLDPATHDQRELFYIMFCNDMLAAEADAFIARLGPDMWPMASYAFRDWRYDGLDAVPVSFIVCLRDGILPVAWQEQFAERFRATRIARIDAGHQAMMTQPAALAEILLAEAAA